VTSTTLADGDAHCPAGGSSFSSASGLSYACNGAPSALSKIDAPNILVGSLGPVSIPPVFLVNLGTVQLTPQVEITPTASGFTGSCTVSVFTTVDGATRALPSQSVSIPPGGPTTDYASPVVLNGGGAGNSIAVNFTCIATSGTGSTIQASVTAIS
jgi:hypothetical protein